MHSKRFTMDETIAQMDNLIRRLMSRGLGDHLQIVGDSPQPTQRSMPSGP
jgi:hypothetical protein